MKSSTGDISATTVGVSPAVTATAPSFYSGPTITAAGSSLGVELSSTTTGHASCIAVTDGSDAPTSYSNGFNVTLDTRFVSGYVNITGLEGLTEYDVYCYLEHLTVAIASPAVVDATTSALCDRGAIVSIISGAAGTTPISATEATFTGSGYSLQVHVALPIKP